MNKQEHFGSKNLNHDYFLNEHKIKSEEFVKDLGVIVNKNLKPSDHINNITKKANALLGQYYRTFSCKDRNTVMKMYTNFVRPLVEYSTTVWSPCTNGNIEKIEKIQRRATRMISGIGKKSYEERLEICDLESLEARRLRFDLIKTYEIINNQYPIPCQKFFIKQEHQHNKNTRSQSNDEISVPKSRLESRKNFFSSRVVNSWNNLPKEIRISPTVESFKRSYDEFVKMNLQ